MGSWEIVRWEERDVDAVLSVWGKAFASRRCGFQVDGTTFRRRVLENPAFDPEGALLATDRNGVVGFALAVDSRAGPIGYLSALVVHPSNRGQGIGSALLEGVDAFVASRGIRELRVRARGNPISCASGVDVSTPAHCFLMNRGFRSDGFLSLVMKMDLDRFDWQNEVEEFAEENRARGIQFGLCGPEHAETLCQMMAEAFPDWEPSARAALYGEPTSDVMVATDGPRVVGFSGPIGSGSDGRGTFLWIGTHPQYRRRKIGTVLFHLLCAEFRRRGAIHTVLTTGLNNPAQDIYFGAGFEVLYLIDNSLVKRFA